MNERTASVTAMGAAWMRAAHQLFDAPPLLLDDPLSLVLLGAEGTAAVRAAAEQHRRPEMRSQRARVALRSRFAEDRLAAAVARGAVQYLILGAGYDTFAYRAPAWAAGLRVVEVDHPASQQEKRARLAAAGVLVPASVTYVGADLARHPLADALGHAGVALEVPTFCAWLGVTMYLPAAAVDAMFRAFAACPAGSEIVYTFEQPPGAVAPTPGELSTEQAAAAAARFGEPWQTFLTPADLTTTLRDAGYGELGFLSAAEADARYFHDRTDGLRAPSAAYIGWARTR